MGALLPAVMCTAALALGQASLAAPATAPTSIEIRLPVAPPPASPGPEKPAAPAVAPDRWLLMKALQGTWFGGQLDGHRLSLSGWTDVSYTFSSANHNLPMGFNYRGNESLLQQNWVRFERPVVTSGTTEPTFGFRN